MELTPSTVGEYSTSIHREEERACLQSNIHVQTVSIQSCVLASLLRTGG